MGQMILVQSCTARLKVVDPIAGSKVIGAFHAREVAKLQSVIQVDREDENGGTSIYVELPSYDQAVLDIVIGEINNVLSTGADPVLTSVVLAT